MKTEQTNPHKVLATEYWHTDQDGHKVQTGFSFEISAGYLPPDQWASVWRSGRTVRVTVEFLDVKADGGVTWSK